MSALMQWGPALLIVFSILLGVIYSNARLNDLRNDLKSYVDARFSASDQRLEDFKRYVEARFDASDQRLDDLKDFIHSEVRRLEDRIDQRLVRP